MKSHGAGQACYRGERCPEGICDACRACRGAIQKRWEQTPAGRVSKRGRDTRYRSTAAGVLADIRQHAKARTA